MLSHLNGMLAGTQIMIIFCQPCNLQLHDFIREPCIYRQTRKSSKRYIFVCRNLFSTA